ncbi:UPF0104 family protein [Neorhizobium sp. NPDC001467]|uniref:UPF0104 family protein n=1 Tax=Neorhizobium sp. NPDC001467 TaxID=3390595 RepID=UPI003CFC280C
MPRVKRHLFRILVALAVCIAAYLVYRALGRYSLADIRASMSAIPAARMAGGLAFVIASYICLTWFDMLALRYVGRPLAYRRAALASFTALSIGHNIGVAALSSGTVRYRFYTRWGLNGEQVAKIILFCGVTVALGLVTLAGLALLLQPGGGIDLLDLGDDAKRMLGLVLLAAPLLYLGFCARVRRPLRLRSWRLEPPSVGLALGQIAVGTANFACVAAALYQLMTAFTAAGYLDVAAAYVTAMLAAIISHVPGGLGVLEAAMLGLMPASASIGALVVFRALYYFLPLLLGVPLLIASEAYYRRRGGRLPQQAEGKPRQA